MLDKHSHNDQAENEGDELQEAARQDHQVREDWEEQVDQEGTVHLCGREADRSGELAQLDYYCIDIHLYIYIHIHHPDK